MAGQRIDDHSSWVGSHGKHSVFPDGPHKVKQEAHAEGFGDLAHYEDTNEEIVRSQHMAKSKEKAHGRKALMRN